MFSRQLGLLRRADLRVGLTCSMKKTERGISTEGGNRNEDIVVTVKNGVRLIRFNRPEKRNAMTLGMMKTLVLSLHQGSEDEETKVVVLTGTGDYFTGGMDMGPRKPVKEGSGSQEKKTDGDIKPKKPFVPEEVRKANAAMFVHSFIDCKKPLIALVNGPVVGVGVTMLGLFDTVYASDKATFLTTFTRFGLPPEFCSTYTFPRIMGYARAGKMLLMDKKITAEGALAGGLVSRIFPHESFVQETSKLVEAYGALPVKSLVYTKELIRGREASLLKGVSDKEQSFFDPEVAREIKRKFMAKEL